MKDLGAVAPRSSAWLKPFRILGFLRSRSLSWALVSLKKGSSAQQMPTPGGSISDSFQRRLILHSVFVLTNTSEAESGGGLSWITRKIGRRAGRKWNGPNSFLPTENGFSSLREWAASERKFADVRKL